MNSRRRISAPKLSGQHCIGSNEHFDRAQTAHQNQCRSAQPMSEMGQGQLRRPGSAVGQCPHHPRSDHKFSPLAAHSEYSVRPRARSDSRAIIVVSRSAQCGHPWRVAGYARDHREKTCRTARRSSAPARRQALPVSLSWPVAAKSFQ